MSQIIEVPGQGPIEFPDGMNDQDIVSVIKKLSAPQEQRPKLRGVLPDYLDANGGKMMPDPLLAITEGIGNAANWAGGKVTDIASGWGASPETAAAAGTGVNMVTQFGAPSGVAGKIGTAISTKGRALAEKLMRGSVGATAGDLARGKAQRAAQVFLDKLEFPTEAGIGRLKAEAMGIGRKVDDEIAKVGGTIPKNRTAAYLQPEIARLESTNALPSGPRSAMEGVYDEFSSNPLIPQDIPLARAQQFKQTLQHDLKNKYGTLAEGEDAAKKALARGIRLEMENVAPNIGPLNAEAAKLWNSINVAERRALMDANKQILGVSPLAHNTVMQAVMLAQRSPHLKPLLAHIINQSTQPIPAKLATALGIGVAIDQPE